MATGAYWSRAVEPDCWEGPKLGLAAGFEGLDNDHAPAAARTSVPRLVFVSTRGVIAVAARRGWVGCAEEPAGQCDIGGSAGIGEEAIMADAVEPVGQDVDQKAANELVGIERHKLVTSGALGAVILPSERHAFAVERDEPTVGNSDPVRVAGQVGEHSAGSAKRPLGIDYPFVLAQCGEVSFEGGRLGQGGLIGEKLQSTGLVRGGHPFEEQAPEELREHPDRQKETRSAGNPMLTVEREAAPGTMIWACGWWVSADPQVCSTAVSPMRAPCPVPADAWRSCAAACAATRAS
jgi:hypothetical protein